MEIFPSIEDIYKCKNYSIVLGATALYFPLMDNPCMNILLKFLESCTYMSNISIYYLNYIFSFWPPVPIYGPLYEVPHAMLGILDKLKFKIDLFTIGKILLKLVIFKKIVSLIAILCLLLFLPSLKHHKESSDNSSNEDVIMMRSLTTG